MGEGFQDARLGIGVVILEEKGGDTGMKACAVIEWEPKARIVLFGSNLI